MGYTPFKMKGPSLYKSPAKDDEQAKARKNVKAMDKELDKLKPKVLKVRKQPLPSAESRYFKDGQDENIEAIIENTPKKYYTKDQKEYLKNKENKAKEFNKLTIDEGGPTPNVPKGYKKEKKKEKRKNTDRYNAVITKYDKDGKVDDRDKWKRTPDWMK